MHLLDTVWEYSHFLPTIQGEESQDDHRYHDRCSFVDVRAWRPGMVSRSKYGTLKGWQEELYNDWNLGHHLGFNWVRTPGVC
jgi:hypothetical protein